MTSTSEPRRRYTSRQRLTLFATSLGLFMIYLDATIVNVALPDIQSDFDAGEQGLQWVVAAYSLTMGMFIMSSATFADRFGRRRALLAGTALFAVASALCGLAPSLMVLNLGRGAQGVGAAIVNVASLALVSAAFPDAKQKAGAIGLWTGVAGVGLAIGPTLGGVLTESIGWRSIFFVNLIIGAVSIVLVRLFVDESRDEGATGFDGRGELLFIAAVGAMTYALIEGPHDGWLSPLIIGLLVAAVVLGTTFVLVELRTATPMMDVRLFHDHVYSIAIVTIFAVLFSIYGLYLVLTQYLQNVEGFSAEGAGLVLLAQTVPLIIFSPVAGRVAGRIGDRVPTLGALAAAVAGLAAIMTGVGTSLLVVCVGLVLLGLAAAFGLPTTTNVAMQSVPAERAGMASGILSAQRALGSTAGFAVMGTVLAAVVAGTLPGKFEPYLPAADVGPAVDVVVADANPRAVASIIGPGKPLPSNVASVPELVDAADDAFVEGIRIALATGLVLCLLTLIVAFFVLPRGTGRQQRVAETKDAHREATEDRAS
ncbi:MAG: DHA2 family efflux MFS transporter permease subunit [Ilumatobacteraceae bacterium]